MKSEPTYDLTVREAQVGARLLKGQKRQTIATELGIHVRTVDFHLWNLQRKARVNSLVSLAVSLSRLNGSLRQ